MPISEPIRDHGDAEAAKRRKKKKPKPKPKPLPTPLPDPFARFALPVLYVTEEGSGVEFAQRAADSGFRSVAIQNSNWSQADVGAIHAAGLAVHLWGIASSDDHSKAADIYGPQIEGPNQADAALTELQHDPRSRTIITNGGGLGDDLVKAHAVAAQIQITLCECYGVEVPALANLNVVTWQMAQYGLPNPFPVIECIRDVGIELYPQLSEWGHRFGVWRAEQMPDKAWLQIKTLLTGR